MGGGGRRESLKKRGLRRRSWRRELCCLLLLRVGRGRRKFENRVKERMFNKDRITESEGRVGSLSMYLWR